METIAKSEESGYVKDDFVSASGYFEMLDCFNDVVLEWGC